jgi:cytochrome c556
MQSTFLDRRRSGSFGGHVNRTTSNRLILLAAVFLPLAACSGSGQQQAEDSSPSDQGANSAVAANVADSIKARQTHYKEIGKAMKAISDELKKSDPGIPIIQENASRMAQLAPQIQGWFPSGSGSEVGLKTAARAEIWSKPEQFRQAASAFVQESANLARIAQGGDLSAIRTAVPAVGKTCKGCHDQFRVDED